MAQYFNLALDTTAPQSCSISFATAKTSTTSVTLNLSATDVYQMKVWGTGINKTESEATWETYAATKALTLTTGDGVKAVSAKFRDDVGNESAAVNASITLDTTAVVITITGPDKSKISKVSGYNESEFSFSAGGAFVEYKVKVVPSTSSSHDAGTVIPTTNGSTNMSGTGTFPAETAITCKINGADLELASSGDGVKIVKVFAKDDAGNWSI